MLTLGIVGWGYWGRNYAKYLNSDIDARLTWVCDLRESMLADAKKNYPHFKLTKNIADLAKAKLDGVILAVPASIHYRLAKFFIENNINLLIEKPLTNNLSQAVELEQIAKKNKVKVLVGHTFLYNQSVRWLKQKIDSKFFGKINFLEFKRQSYGPIRDDVNIVWDFAPHDLAMADYLLNGSQPIEINATAARFSRRNQEDIAVITLQYPNNILVNINVAWLYPIKIRNLTLLGAKKMAIFDDTNTNEPLKIYDASIKYPSVKEPYCAGFRLADIIIPRITPIDPLYSQIKHFVNYLKNKEKPITPISNGVKIVHILDKIDIIIKKLFEKPAAL